MSTQPNIPEDQKKTIRLIMSLAGFAFIIFGLATFTIPAIGEMIFGDDTFITQIFAGSLIFVGTMDIIIAKFLFKDDTK